MREDQRAVHRHIHKNEDVTLERLEAFAEDKRQVQLLVLAKLRSSSNARELSLPILAIILAILSPALYAWNPLSPLTGNLLTRTIATSIVALFFVAICSLGIGIPAILEQMKAARALVWLRAYEDELARRSTMRGREGRRWRRTH